MPLLTYFYNKRRLKPKDRKNIKYEGIEKIEKIIP